MGFWVWFCFVLGWVWFSDVLEQFCLGLFGGFSGSVLFWIGLSLVWWRFRAFFIRVGLRGLVFWLIGWIFGLSLYAVGLVWWYFAEVFFLGGSGLRDLVF